jgi:hypothetical protein
MMDDQFRVPGTNLRFGLDFLLGLFPGLGDAVTSVISLLIVHHAWQSGASKLTLARMLGNVGVDFSGRLGAAVRRCVRPRLEGEPQERAAALGAFEKPFGQVGGGLA